MQVTETLAEGLKHEFQISVPASDLDAKADARLVDLKDKVRLNGFRPGKVPVSHLKKVYGRSVMAETIDQTIRRPRKKPSRTSSPENPISPIPLRSKWCLRSNSPISRPLRSRSRWPR
jgi:FKBP-type peptidyl-prolyl cis-trans isomerase (trigger factor)